MKVVKLAKPFSGSFSEIERFASELRETANKKIKTSSTKEMLNKVTSFYGGRIEVADAPTPFEEDGGSLIINTRNDFIIHLSPFTSPFRDNFTVAHELGHYFLHYVYAKETGRMEFTRYGSGPVEWQANRFAAAFLMPEQEFKRIMKKYVDDLSSVAAHFQVSKPAVKVRSEYIR